MPEPVVTAVLLILPLAASGSFHMLVVRRNLLPGLARPIHARAFGRNKTWRGVVVMALATVPTLVAVRWLAETLSADVAGPLAAVSPVGLGLALGLAYAAAELPNSYWKRRLGIAPGRPAERHRVFFTLLDQADSAIGCMLVYAWLLDISAAALVLIVVLGPGVHLLVNLSLYAAGLRREAF